MSGKQPPAHTVRRGKISGQVWHNTNKHGAAWYSVTVARHFVDEKGIPRTAQSFGVADLLVVAEVVRHCWEWVTAQTQPGHDPVTPEEGHAP